MGIREFSDISGHQGNRCPLQIHPALNGHFFLPVCSKDNGSHEGEREVGLSQGCAVGRAVSSRGCVPAHTQACSVCTCTGVYLSTPKIGCLRK